MRTLYKTMRKDSKVTTKVQIADESFDASVESVPNHIVLKIYDEATGTQAYSIDGKLESLQFELVDDIQFLDDHYCYIAREGLYDVFVLDGEVANRHKNIANEATSSSKDRILIAGNNYAYKVIQKVNGRRSETYVVNGVEEGFHSYVSMFEFFGNNGEHHLYQARSYNENSAVVVDGRTGQWFRQIVWCDVSGENFAYKGDSYMGIKEAYVVNGIKGKWYDEIAWPEFKGGKHIYNAILRNPFRSFPVVNGNREIRIPGMSHVGGLEFCGDDYICYGSPTENYPANSYLVFLNGQRIGEVFLERPQVGFTEEGRPWVKGKTLLA